MNREKQDHSGILVLIVFITVVMLLLFGDKKKSGASNVSSYITKKGKFVKAHGRRSTSTAPDAARKRGKSRYYYQTHKHSLRKKK